MGLHRTLALGTSAFLLTHVATAVGETDVEIDLVSAVLPFTSGYEPLWVGLGTLAVDIVAAVVATSLLRHRLPERLWRGVHVLAFALAGGPRAWAGAGHRLGTAAAWRHRPLWHHRGRRARVAAHVHLRRRDSSSRDRGPGVVMSLTAYRRRIQQQAGLLERLDQAGLTGRGAPRSARPSRSVPPPSTMPT
jgi:hypothetical protein